MKKKSIIIGFLPLLSSSVFAVNANKLGSAVASINFRVMDIPLLDGMAYFISTMDKFATIAGTIAIVLFMATLIWNAFRLWFGTQQVRKAAVDIMLKCLLFTAVFASYQGIRSGVMDLSMKIGSYAGGGAAEVATRFSDLKESVELKLNVSRAYMIKMFQKTQEEGGGTLSETDIKNFSKGVGLSEEKIKEYAEKYGLKITDSAWTAAMKDESGGALITAIIQGASNKIAYKKMLKKLEDEEQKTFEKMVKNGEGEDIKNLLAGFAEVLYENPDWTTADESLKSSIEKYIYSPFITTSEDLKEGDKWSLEKWKATGMDEGQLVSPAALMKTCVLVANVIMAYSSSDVTNGTKKKFLPSWDDVGNFIIMIIMCIGIIASGVFVCIQYSMCIFEYWIVTSLGILFVPCILFDGTKTYASKLIQLFVAYFVKITIILLCIFWTFSTYINASINIIGSSHPVSLLNFAYIFFALILGFVVTQNAPQIAMTMLNGTPQLSMGEFMHAAGTAAAGAALAKKGATAAAKKAAPVVKGANAGFAEGAAAAAGAWKGAGEAGAGFGTKFKMAAGAGFKQTASAWDSGIKDHASRLLTGKESSSHNASSLHVGVGSAKELGLSSAKADKSGNVTNKNITEAYTAQAKQKAQEIEAEKAKKKDNNSTEQPSKVNISGSEQKSELG